MSKDLVEVAAEVWAQDRLSMPERVTIGSRFRSNEMSVAPYPITQLEVPMV